jgi:hypothetical protein
MAVEQSPARSRSRQGFAGEAVAFVATTLLGFDIDLGGRVFIGEFVLILVLPWILLVRRDQPGIKVPVAILVLGGLWLASQLIADLLADSASQDAIRAWSKIVLALVDVIALSLLLNSARVARFAVLGLCAGLLLAGAISPPAGADFDPWKWEYGYPITVLVVLCTTIEPIAKHRVVSVALILGIGVANLLFGFRSLGLTCTLAAIVLAVRLTAMNRGVPDWTRVRRARVLGIAALLLGGLLFVQAYGFAAGNGLLGPENRLKYEQEAGGALGLLVGGRVEILVSAQAFADSPLFGHGAYAQDFAYVDLLADRLQALGYPVSVPEDGRIPTHSYLLGSAVEAGVLGLLFWLAIATAGFRWLWMSFSASSPITALSVFLLMQLLWDVFFSPFNGAARVSFALTLAVALYVVQLGSATPWGNRVDNALRTDA